VNEIAQGRGAKACDRAYHTGNHKDGGQINIPVLGQYVVILVAQGPGKHGYGEDEANGNIF
jgi:hypothetical protein